MIVLLLTAATLGPYLIDWNAFRGTFEREASEILGQEVRILGDAELRLLPTPSLTFDRVEIGNAEGQPLATIDRVAMRMEFIAFLSGRIAITEMTIEGPQVDLIIDDGGQAQLLSAPIGAAALDPDRVSLKGVTITAGVVRFQDARTQTAFELVDINTNLVEATALSGPWRVDGNFVCVAAVLCGEGTPVAFSLTTGRALPDGSFRLNTQLIPAAPELAGTLTTEGIVSAGEGGLVYAGTLRFDKLLVAESPRGSIGDAPMARAWNIVGAFAIDGSALTLSTFTFGLDTLALEGHASIALGANSSFSAAINTRQIDLNTLIGETPTAEIGAADAASQLLGLVRQVALPDLDGTITVAIPVILAAGTRLEDFNADLHVGDGAWDIASLSVGLPGASRLEASGRLSSGAGVAFEGRLALSSQQPAALLSWWSGVDPATVRLSPFAIAGEGRFDEAGVVADHFDLTIGPSHASGRVAWLAEPDAGWRLEADITAEAFDIDQALALGGFLQEAPDATVDTYNVRLRAGSLGWGAVQFDEVELAVAVDPAEIVVETLTIGNLGGARVMVEGGRLDRTAAERGSLQARMQADRLDGVAALAGQLWPGSTFASWLAGQAGLLVPLDLVATVSGPGALGGLSADIAGTAAGTGFGATASLAGAMDDWARHDAEVTIEIANDDAAMLVRQAGFALPAAIAGLGRANLSLDARGIPAEGMTNTNLSGTIGGFEVNLAGTLGVGPDQPVSLAGSLDITATDLIPAMLLLGVTLPPTEAPVPAVIRATMSTEPDHLAIAMAPNSTSIGARAVEGSLALSRRNERLAIDGDLGIGELDLGWLASLVLGVDPLPTADPAAPWLTTAFLPPVFGAVDVALEASIGRLIVAPETMLLNADLDLILAADRAAFDLRSATFAGGTITANAALALADGQARVEGRVDLAGVDLAAIVWRRDGQPVAEGTMDLNAELSAIGRSPAGLAASLNGSAVLTVNDGTFAFMNEAAFAQAIDLLTANPTIGDIALRDRFTELLDAGRFAFTSATAALEVLGGYVTAQRTIVEGTETTISMRTLVDLNLMTVDADWTLASIAEANNAAAPRPSVSIGFTGPLAAPDRTVSIAGLVPYLRYLQSEERDRLDRQLLEQEYFLRRIEADRLMAPPEAAPAAGPEPEPPAAPAVVPPPRPATATPAPLVLPAQPGAVTPLDAAPVVPPLQIPLAAPP